MSEVLDRVREKYPQYKDVPDDDLALGIGSKYPAYIQGDEAFKAEFQKAAAQKSLDIALRGTGEVLKILTNPLAAEASQMGREQGELSRLSPTEQLARSRMAFAKPAGEAVKAATEFATTPLVGKLNLSDMVEAARQFTASQLGVAPEQLAAKPTEEGVSRAARESKTGGLIAGVAEGLQETDRFFSSPVGIATLGTGFLPAAAQRLIALGFSAQMAKEVPHIATELGSELGKPEDERDYRKIGNLVTQATTSTGFTVMGVLHGLAPREKAAEPVTSTEEIKTVAPQTAAALEQTGKGPSAIQRETTEVLQPVQPQPEQGVREVPAERPSPEAGARGEQALPQEAQTVSDYQRYLELQAEMKRAFRAGDQEALAKAFAENEQIKNRHGGMPPKPPETVPTVTETTPQAEPAAEPTAANARPAIRLVGGEVVTGEAGQTHPDIIAAKGLKAEEIDQRGFVDDQGNFLDREQAAQQTGLPTQKEADRLHSTDLPEAKEEVPPATMAGAAHISEIPETGAGGEKYGVAERIRQERAKAGQVPEIPRGEGIETLESIQRGRAMLQAEPGLAERLMGEFESTKALSADAMAVARAHGEALAAKARTIEERFGTDSDEYRAARDELAAWDRRSKAMQTEWHKAGMAQQGETDIDTGSFTGLQRAYMSDTGKVFTQTQETNAKRIAKGVKDAEGASGQAEKNLAAEIEHEFPKERVPRSSAEQRALDAVNKTIRKLSVRLAKAESKSRVATTVREKETADIQTNAARKALEAAQEHARKAADALAKKERELLASPELKVWEQARIYLEKGEGNFDDIRHKIATDLGMSVKKVTDMLAYTKKLKGLADDVWRKRQQERTLKLQAKRWLHDQSVPFFQRTVQKLPRFLFGLKVFGHGTVALGTHAPMLAFQPQFWPEYARNFGRMYGMVFKPAYHERLMQELVRKDNYTTAQRAGLQNNPFQFEEYVDPNMNVLVRKLTGGGSRGYSVLKLLRQDVFDHYWNNLPKTQQIPEIAQALAESINHVTGVTQKGAPRGTHILLFAPRLEASRVAWLAVDPVKSMLTLLNWKNSSYGDRVFAINQIKEKLTVAGTMGTLLGLNQAILSYSDSKQKVNFTNPLESDFLKFKAGGMNVSYGNPMISMARLPLRLWSIGAGTGRKGRNIVYPDEQAGTALFDYLRSQESPFASLATDLILRVDPTGRPLPHSTQPVPARLRRKGIGPYTWPEFLTEQLSPIPLQEAIKEVWGEQFGMSDQQQKALATMLFMWGTGGRMSEDLNVQ